MVVQVSPEQAQQYARSQYPELREAGRLLLQWIEKHRAPADISSLEVLGGDSNQGALK